MSEVPAGEAPAKVDNAPALPPRAAARRAIGRASRDPIVWAVCVLGLLYFGWVAARPSGAFWSLDEGGKFIYLKNVIQTGDPRAALDYPGRTVDPGLNFVPLYFSIRQGDQIYSWWPVAFPLLSMPFYRAFGWLGLYLLPAAAGATSAGLAGWLVRELAPKPGWLAPATVLITGLATPVAFYSATFWEHTLSAAALMGAVVCVMQALGGGRPRWLLAAGFLGAIATWLRFDIAALMAGLWLALLWRRWRWGLLGGVTYAAGCGAWLLLNWFLMGHPISRYWGLVEDATVLGGARDAGLAFVGYILFNAPAVLALALPTLVLAGGTVAAGVAVAAPRWRAWRWLSLPAYVGLLGISVYVLLNTYGYRSVHGFLLIAPHVIFAAWLFSRQPSAPPDKVSFFRAALLLMTLIYGAAFVARSWVAAGGLQWGPRYMLAFYPLYSAAAVVGLGRAWPGLGPPLRAGLLAAYLACVGAGAGFQVRGAYSLWETVTAFARAEKSLGALSAEALVTRCTWMAMVLPDLYWTGKVFAVTDFDAWAASARAAGVNSGYVVDMDACLNIPLDEVAGLLAHNPDGITAEPFRLESVVP